MKVLTQRPVWNYNLYKKRETLHRERSLTMVELKDEMLEGATGRASGKAKEEEEA